MTYRGFEITKEADGYWARTGAGIVNLGPFETMQDAKHAIDVDFSDDEPTTEDDDA